MFHLLGKSSPILPLVADTEFMPPYATSGMASTLSTWARSVAPHRPRPVAGTAATAASDSRAASEGCPATPWPRGEQAALECWENEDFSANAIRKGSDITLGKL